MEIKLLKMTASVRKKYELIFCDFQITVAEFEIVIKGCQLTKNQVGNLILSFPKAQIENGGRYTSVFFCKPEQHEEFRHKAVELIKLQNPELQPYKEESYVRETNGADPKFAKRDRKVFAKGDKPSRREDNNNGSVSGNKVTETESTRPKIDVSKYVDLPPRISKPGRNPLR